VNLDPEFSISATKYIAEIFGWEEGVRMESLRKAFAICEVAIGIIGIFLFITGPFLMFLFMFFGITAMVLGFAGVSELTSTRPRKSFLILLILSICYIIVFPYRGVGGLGFEVPSLAAALWPFFNVIAVLPSNIKSVPLILLVTHLFLIAFDKAQSSKMMRVLTVIIIFLTIGTIIFGEELGKQIAVVAERGIKSGKLEMTFRSSQPINTRYIVEGQDVKGLDKIRKEYLNLEEVRTIYIRDNLHADYPPIVAEIGIFKFKDDANIAVDQYNSADQRELTDKTGRLYREFISEKTDLGEKSYWRVMDNKIKIYVQKINVLIVLEYPMLDSTTAVALKEAKAVVEEILQKLFSRL